MLIEILSTFHGILCFSIIAIIYFAKPDTSGLSTLSQNFNSNNSKKTIRFRPITKVIFINENHFLSKIVKATYCNNLRFSIFDHIYKVIIKVSCQFRQYLVYST